MKKISLVFFSTYGDNQFKAQRILKYMSLFEDNNYFSQFIGIGSNPTHSRGRYLQVANSNSTMLIYIFLNKVLKPIGLGTFARFIAIWFLSQYAKKKIINSDYLFTQAYFYNLIKFAKKNNVKVIIEHDLDFPEYNWKLMQKSNKRNKIKIWNRDSWNFYPYVSNANKSLFLADKIVVFSDYALSTFKNSGVTLSKIILSRPPVEKKYLEINAQKSELPKFYWIGNHGIRKGIDLLEQAWSEYIERGGRGELHLCGEVSPSQKSIRRRLSKMHNVTDHGKIDTYKFVKDEKRILISPSISEGLPRAAVEAAFAGNPIIATYPGGSELITEGKSGWKIEIDTESIVAGLFRAESEWDKVVTYGLNARNEVLEKTKNYYQDVLKLFKN